MQTSEEIRSQGNRTKPVKNVQEALLSSSAVAEILGLKERTVRYQADVGLLPGFKVGKLWKFYRTEIDDWLLQQRQK